MTTEMSVIVDQIEASEIEGAATEQDQPKAESLPPLQTVSIPLNFLRAAVPCSSTEETRYYLNGLFIHAVEGRGRVVAADGHRLFIGSFGLGLEEGAEIPDWLKAGVIVHNEGLGAKLAMIGKLSDVPLARLTYAHGAPRVLLSDVAEEATFKCLPVDGTFPDYQRIMVDLTGGVTMDKDAAPRDFEAVSFNGAYLKGVGDLSKILSGAKDGGTVSVHARKSDEAAIITFPEAPGAVLILMPKRADPLHNETVAIIAPAIKGTLAALRAHLTRNQEAAEQAMDPAEKQRFVDRAVDYQQRIDDLLRRTLERPALPPAAEASEPSETEATETGDELADGNPIGSEAEPSDTTESPAEPATEPQGEAVAEAPANEDKPKSRKDRRQARHVARKAA